MQTSATRSFWITQVALWTVWHRVCKALLQGIDTVAAVQFDVDPEPDYVGRDPDSLPYDDAE